VAALLAASPARAQTPDSPRHSLRALLLETGLLVQPPARATARFGAGAEVGHSGLPGTLHLGLSAWIAEAPAGFTLRGRELSVLWLLASPPFTGTRIRLLAELGPALATVARADSAARPLPGALAALGLRLPLAAHDALALELRATTLTLVRRPLQRSLRLGLRFAPGVAGGLAAGEPAHPAPPIMAQLAPPPPDVGPLADASGGLLAPGMAAGDLELDAGAFDSTDTGLRPEAANRLTRTGRSLRRLGADPLWVIIYAGSAGRGDVAASRRAVAVGRALARGGYPARRIYLEVARGVGTPDTGGRIVAGRECLTSCAAPARRP